MVCDLFLSGCGESRAQRPDGNYNECLATKIVGVNTKDGKLTASQREALSVGRVKEIPRFRLVAEPLSPEAEAASGFEWASPEVGTRHQLGGAPEEPGGEPPACPSCVDSMTYYGQLDSIGDDIVLADAGVVQVFVFGCFEAAARVRSS